MGGHNCYRTDEVACIRKKAYEVWEKNGRKPGRDLEYWLIAEKTVKGPRTTIRPKRLNKEAV